MNAHLALEAEVLDVPRRALEAFAVVQVHPHAVDGRLQAGQPRYQYAFAAVGEQLALAATPGDAHVEREIAGAEGDAPDARARRGNGAHVGHALGRLDDRNDVAGADRQFPLRLEAGDDPVDRLDLVGGLDFRQDNAVDALVHDGDDIAVAERR